jgi:hypothetical protein
MTQEEMQKLYSLYGVNLGALIEVTFVLLWRKVQCITLVPQFKMDVGFGFAAVV